jgi:hypothetical protein
MLKDYLSKLFPLILFLGITNCLFGQYVETTFGKYPARPGLFGPDLTADFTGEIVLVDDGDLADVNGDGIPGTITDGCQALMNDVSGKIAMIDRGECAFVSKVTTAQTSGAIAVIICNNDAANPDQIRVMGGDDVGVHTINSVFMSLNDCAEIKMALSSGTVSATLIAPIAGEACHTAITAVEGVNTVPAITGASGVYNDVYGAAYYTYTPATDGVLNINSCGGGVDTRLNILAACPTPMGIPVALTADDECDEGAGEIVATELEFIAYANTQYIIYWDDRWSADGFDFNLSLSALPTVDVKFTVDMNNETVSAQGVLITVNGGAPADMLSNGDGTYSYTYAATAGYPIEYRIWNGTTQPEDNAEILDCGGVDDGMGNISRTYLPGLEPAQDVPTHCFNSCFPCPPPACSNPYAVICDNFDDYTIGNINGQAPYWGIWTGGQDGQVSNAQANSGTQSLNISNNNTTDLLLLLGNQSTGQWKLSWKMYIPTGSVGYYNVQEDEAPGVAWNLEASFGVTNTGGAGTPGQATLRVNGAAIGAAFPYPQDTWFDVVHMFDLDKDEIRYFVNGKLIATTPYVGNIGSIDFFSITTANNYYVDDLEYLDLPEPTDCNTDAIICDGLEFYADGSLTGPQAPWWTTWSGVEGTTEDGIVSDDQAYEGLTSLKIEGNNGPQDVLLLLGNRTSGRYLVSWYMYVPSGFFAYYNIQESETAGVAWNLNVQFNGDGTGDADGDAFTFPHDQWFWVANAIDLDNNVAYLLINDQIVRAWNYTGNLGAVDLYPTNSGPHLFYNDNFVYEQLPSSPGDYCFGAININSFFHQGLDLEVTTPLYDNTEAGADTDNFDPTTGWECYLEPDGTGSAPSLDNNLYFTFVGDGETYYIRSKDCGSGNFITDGDTQFSIYTGGCGNLTPVAGACVDDDIDNGAGPGNWFAGLEFPTTAGVTYYLSVDGFAGAIGEFCLSITQKTGAAPTTAVTFEVDLDKLVDSGTPVSPNGVHLAGNMQDEAGFPGDWDPSTTELTNVAGTNKYRVTLNIPAGTYEYKFINGNAWANCGVGAQECLASGLACGTGANDNRLVVVGLDDFTESHCYNECGACIAGNAGETAFSQAVKATPNPANNYVNLSYNFETATDLQIRLINTLGQVLQTSKIKGAVKGIHVLDIATLPSGAYMVVFSNGENTVAKRLIVE